MAPRITIVGGGSYQWVPKLLVDFANTSTLRDAEIVLDDLDPLPLPKMVALAEHIAGLRGLDWRVVATTDRAEALDGTDYVVVAISCGGLASMRHDLDIPTRYGVHQPGGDSVGPGGILRSMRSIPVLVDLARDMERRCPDAWMINLSNPLTALCRAVTRETSIRTVGLCNEVIGGQFVLSLLLDVGLGEVDPVVAGVNHLPLVTELRVGDRDGFQLLRELLEQRDERGAEPVWMNLDGIIEGYERRSTGERWTKGDVLANNRLKLELFERFGVLPGSHDAHVAEFFPGFVTEESGWGRGWGVHVKGLEYFEREQARCRAQLGTMLDAPEVSPWPSGELLAPLLDALSGGTPKNLPVNLPNTGQVANLPEGAVVEAIATVDGGGIRPRDHATVPGVLGEYLRRVSVSQELTVDAALSGNRTTVLEAMLADPLAGRLPYEQVDAMAEEMLAATARWLPQFA